MYEPTEQYDLLQGLGFGPRVAESIDRLYQDGVIPELSDQVIDSLKELTESAALACIHLLRQSDLSTVKNRNAYFLGLIKQNRGRLLKEESDASDGSYSAAPGPSAPASDSPFDQLPTKTDHPSGPYDVHGGEDDGYSAYMMTGGGAYSGGYIPMYHQHMPSRNGPDEAALQEILERTGYTHEVSGTLRKYGGPPPNWTGPKPNQGVEVFIGKLARDVYEDDLIPLMEKSGRIYELRVITDQDGYNRGYAFVTFCDKAGAKAAVASYDGITLRGRAIVVKLSVQFTKLYIGGIPKDKTREQIFAAFSHEVEKLTDVIIQEPDELAPDSQNKGYCFLEFDSYFDAAAARRKLMHSSHCIKSWDNLRKFKVDWAIPLENPDESAASNSTVILVTRLTDGVTHTDLQERFGRYGAIKTMNKRGHHAFVTFEERAAAERAAQEENNQFLKDAQLEVTVHVPLTTVAKRMVETIKGPRGRGYYGIGYSRGGFRGGGGGRGFPRGGGGGLDRAGTVTRARVMSRGVVQGDPHHLRGGSGVNKRRHTGAAAAVQTIQQLGSSFTQF